MRLAPLAALAFASAAALAVACTAETSDVATAEAASTEARPLVAVKGREWARCWFDVTGADAQLSCTSTKRADGDPLATTFEVTAATLSATAFLSATKKLDLEAGGTVVVGTFPKASFPILLMMKADLPRSAIQDLGVKRFLDINNNVKVARAEDVNARQPAIVKQPFDLWPTALIDPKGGGGFAINAAYETSIAPYKSFGDETAMPFDVGFFGTEVVGKIRWWAAPANGRIPVSINGPAHVDSAITGPGYYAVTAQGLRQATPEEIAKDFPRGAPTSAEAGAPVEADAGVDTTVDAAPPDPTPGCGGDGQAKCADGTCDPGHRHDSSSGTCLSCGTDGKTFCRDSNGNAICNPGHRYDSSSGTCLSCGTDGKTFCRDSNGNAICNPGHRYDSSSGTCLSCGTDGKTFCRDSNGNAVCDPGHRYDSSSGTCLSCGGAGQTFCRNANGNAVCNPGLRYDSATATCVPQ